MKLIVNPHKIEIEKSPVNEKELNITEIEFEFAEEITNNFVKEAYFTLNNNSYKKIIVNNKCGIPSEVLTHKGQVEIGVVAYLVENEEEIKRYNPSPVYISTLDGSLKNAQNTEPITPSELEQYQQALQDGLTEVNEKLDDIDQALEDVNTAITETNNLDLDVSKSGKVATVTLSKKDASVKTVTLSDGTNLMFNWDGTKLGIKTDEDVDYQYVDLQGVQGETGPMGAPFTIKKTYSSVAEMNADFNNMQVGDYVMITSTVEIEDNAKLYSRGETQWIFITDFSGATGIQGPTGATPNIQIGTVTSGDSPTVTRTGTNENPVLNFVLEKGDKGDQGVQGETGNGIVSITKTGTVDTVDTYTILYTNGDTTTFTVTNGEVSQAQLDALEDKVEYYKKYSNALILNNNTGTNLSINNTAECPMEIGLNGNTSQISYTGKNLWGGFTYSGTSNDVDFTYNNDGSITANGTATGTATSMGSSTAITNNYLVELQAGTYTIQGAVSGDKLVRVCKSDGTTIKNNTSTSGDTFTITETTSAYIIVRIASGQACNNETFKIMLSQGTDNTYEPFVGKQPSPNPSYPQTVHVVKGNNNINVCGKNLWGGFTYSGTSNDVDFSYVSNGTITANGTAGNNSYSANGVQVFNNKLYVILPAGTYTVSLTDLPSNTSWQIGESLIDSTTLNLLYSPSTTYKTFTLSKETRINIRIHPANGTQVTNATVKVMLVHGDTALDWEPYQSQTYPINLGSLEYCKIGDYSDKIDITTGKNLFNMNDIYYTNHNKYTVTANVSNLQIQNTSTVTNLFVWYNIPVNLEKQITISYENLIEATSSVNNYVFYMLSDTLFTEYVSGSDFIQINKIAKRATVTTTKGYLVIGVRTANGNANNLTNLQVEYGIKATDYEPYGIGSWYKYSMIGKTIFDGSSDEGWTYTATNTTDIKRMESTMLTNYIVKPATASTAPAIFSNYYTPRTANQTYTLIVGIGITSAGYIVIYDENYNTSSSVSLYKTWLSTHNLILYYPLATPTYTEITDSTLITQLNNISRALSYKTQTNITQVNADLPFNLDVDTIYDLNALLTRVETLETEV